MSFDLTEHDRRIAGIVSVGTIYKVDVDNARARVAVGGLRSDWLPWISGRAGPDKVWWAPEEGEQVLVLSPSGELSQGYILAGIYRDKHPAPSKSADQHITLYQDGTTIAYDRKAGTYLIDCVGDVVIKGARTLKIEFEGQVDITTKAACNVNAQGAVTVVSPASVTVDSPTTTVTGNLQVNGNIHSDGDTVAGAVSLQNHVHSGVRGGPDKSGPPD